LPPAGAIAEVNTMIERYYRDTGEMPSGSFLVGLSNAVLSADLTDNNVDKITSEGYPFLNDTQFARRRRREVSIGHIGDIDSLRHYGANITMPRKRRRHKALKGARKQLQSWAMAVKERDGYRCQNPKCRSRNGIMHAHHIHNYADYPELREDIDNGITLCVDCHVGFHAFFGKKANNRRQLDEYFS